MSDYFYHRFKKSDVSRVDKAMAVAAVVHPLMGVPQAYKIFHLHTAAGVSLQSWVAFAAIGVIYAAYAIVHRIRPLIVTQMLWFVVDAFVIAGILIYR